MFLERVRQPGVELHFFSVCCSNKIRLPSQQTLGSGEPNKILGRFDFVFEVFVFCFDVIDRFLRCMGLPVADECRVRFRNVIEKVIDRFVQGLCRRKLRG